jgi:hypothetical protein
MTASSCTTKTTHKKFETQTTTNINWKFGFYISWLKKLLSKKIEWNKQEFAKKELWIVTMDFEFIFWIFHDFVF